MNTGRAALWILVNVLPLALWSILAVSARAQPETAITGVVVDAEDRRPIPSAHVALFDSAATHVQAGTVSDAAGRFRLTTTLEEPGVLRVSFMGYEAVTRTVRPTVQAEVSLGDIALPRVLLDHEEVVIQGEQVQARSEADRTTYYVDENLQDATTSGTDVLKFIPGVQVDLMQNISLEGRRQVLVLVNGRQRDPAVLGQLNAVDIERVEVMKTPPARYDAEVSGIINVVLKEKPASHLSGHVHLEAPGSTDAMYLFPAYSLQYGTGKVDLFTAYRGDFRYFDIEEVAARTASVGSEVSTWNTTQTVRQKNRSHRFTYGLDYVATDRQAVSVYGWVNPFSGEMDGDVASEHPGRAPSYSSRQERDANLATFHSLHYTRTPDQAAGHELSVEASVYTRDSENRMTFSDEATGARREHATRPSQQTYRLKTDYALPLQERSRLQAGVQARYRHIQNDEADAFEYTDASFAAYGTLEYRAVPYQLQAGVRAERYRYGIDDGAEKTLIALFPNAVLRYTLPDASTIKLAYRRSVRYPQLYQLNPGRFFEDPYAFWTGNLELGPAFVHDVNLEYARIFGSSYVSVTLFYTRTRDAMERLTSLTEDGLFEANSYNLGRLRQYGLRFSGNLDIKGRVGVQPYLRLFEVHALPGAFARDQGVAGRRSFAWDAGVSAHVGLGRGFFLSGVVDYASPLRRMQQVAFSDALYFVSVGRSIGEGGKVEVVSGLPLSKTFTYRGREIEAQDFDSRSEGVIDLSSMPLIFRFVYRFSKGEERDRIDHGDVDVPPAPGRGF